MVVVDVIFVIALVIIGINSARRLPGTQLLLGERLLDPDGNIRRRRRENVGGRRRFLASVEQVVRANIRARRRIGGGRFGRLTSILECRSQRFDTVDHLVE